MDAHYFYQSQTPAKLQLLNTQNSTPLKAELVTSNSYNPELSILNCSAKHYDDVMAITSLNGQTDLLYTISSPIKTFEAPLKSCTKMYNVSFVPWSYYYAAVLITWDTPNCSYCEAEGQYCKLKNNISSTGMKPDDPTTICFPKDHGPPNKAILAGEIGGPFFILLLFVAFY